MREPDWDKAPEWAKWFAIDSDGQRWFHETKPYISDNDKFFTSDEKRLEVFDEPNWKESLRQKPRKPWWEVISIEKAMLLKDNNNGQIVYWSSIPPYPNEWTPATLEEIKEHFKWQDL